MENKLLDGVAKTATAYSVGDFYTKESASRTKMNTLTLSGIARDVDNGHIFIFDAVDKKRYEFVSLDVDMTADNILAEYPCTKAFFGKGLIKGNNLFYLSGNINPADSVAANPVGTLLYLFRYGYKTDSAPEQIDSLSCVEAGITSFQSAEASAFIDDYLIHHHTANTNTPSPVLRIVGNTAKVGFTGVYYTSSNTNYMVQRMSPNRQILLSGNNTTGITRIPPMALSHLLLPEPIVKTNERRLSVSYTISIQD